VDAQAEALAFCIKVVSFSYIARYYINYIFGEGFLASENYRFLANLKLR
jgi:hypothetical protein